MSNNNNRYNSHHQTIQHHHHFQPKTIFLPIFCRLSLKDINQNNTRNRGTTDEPSSPKVTCIGQVKRNNRVTGFPTNAIVETTHQKHTKLRKTFSSKVLLPPAPSTSTRNGNRTCGNNKNRLRSKNEQVECVKVVVNVGEMDPPLPVVKKVGIGGRDEVNIWKRRFHGTRLEGLQIENIHNVNSCKVDQLLPTV